MDIVDVVLVIIFVAIIMIIARRAISVHKRIKFPRNFILSFDNTEKPIKALMKMVDVLLPIKPKWFLLPLIRLINANIPNSVKVDFSKVTRLNEATYMLFLAQVEKVNSMYETEKPVYLYGVLQCSSLTNILIRKKKYLHKKLNIADEKKIDALVYSSIDTSQIDEVVKEVTKIGIMEYYSPLYDFLIELVGNATEHGLKSHNINWWMYSERNQANKCINYTFVDMGSGIINSYKSNRLCYKIMPDKYIIRNALKGRLGSTTNQEGRGRGLPQINLMVEKGLVSDFVLITNGVSLRYKNGKWDIKSIPNFKGTCYSWNIYKENYYTWKQGLK